MSKSSEKFKERLAEEFKKIDWDKNDISIRGVECWGKNDHNDGGFVVRWSKPHCGFGELTFCVKDGALHCDTECMSRKFVSQVLEQVANSAVIDDQ